MALKRLREATFQPFRILREDLAGSKSSDKNPKSEPVKLERWAILFVGGKDTNNQPKSCFNCPHLFKNKETCEFIGPDIILRRVKKDGQVYTPVCGYQIGGLPQTVEDDPKKVKYLGKKEPDFMALEWAKGPGTNCYGFAGGAECEHFIHTEGEDGICEVMTKDDNKVDSDDCCSAHKGEHISWQEAQKLISSRR